MSATPSLPEARLAVLDAIRRGEGTVNAIAAALGVTDNAVRLHLGALERDGLIERGLRRSGQAGQPAAVYALTTTGEVSLSAAYPSALTALVSALGDRLEPRTAKAVFLDAGRRLAQDIPSRMTGTVHDRANDCAQLIESLGGFASVSTANGKTTITGAGCPLASAVHAEPATCYIVEALLAKTSGLRVTQQCDHGDRPACRFDVS